MKKFNRFSCVMVFVGLLMVSCSKDDDPTLENEQNAIEERIIPASELGAGIEIVGGTKKNGTLPAPNGNLDFDINPDQQEAFQSFGFDIRFSPTADITGAYIQFQDMSGNKADGYFDVSLSDAENGRLSPHGHLKKANTFLSGARTKEDNEREINVNFDKTILPGQFCYEIRVYDAEGNISQPQKVCVKVEAWGGNAAIVGEWVFDRHEPVEEDGGPSTIHCENGQTIIADYTQTEKDEWTFVLNEDGSYYEIYDEAYKNLDYLSSAASCSAVYGETEEEKDKYSGHWAYNEEKQTLTLVDFKYEDLLDASNNDEDEEGELYFEGVKAEVIDGKLILTETYTEDGVKETEKYIFKKK